MDSPARLEATGNCAGQQQPAIDAATTTTTGISKTQLKKLNKRQRWLEGRGERRKAEREKRKLKRKALALDRDQQQNHESCDDGDAGGDDTSKDKIESNKTGNRLYNLMANSSNKFKVVIDMDFEDCMTESELKKSVLQVGRIYAANRHSKNPCQLYICSVKGKVQEAFNALNTGYKNWDVHCSELDYVTLFKSDNSSSVQSSNDQAGDHAALNSTKVVKDFIYLSGDSDTVLSDVDTILKDDSKIFVIGGLVDHNRHKNLCYNRALERGIPTARLPIKEHVTLSQRHILATLTVFEIMLQVLGSHKSWQEALVSAIPKRKLAQPQSLIASSATSD